MGTGSRTAGRVCFWTSGVQESMLYALAGYYDISRSAAVEMIVRAHLDSLMESGGMVGEMLAEVSGNFQYRHPLAAAKDAARREVDKAVRSAVGEVVD